jgi:hypothetical protein
MKGIFWNTNGLKDPQKLKHISDLTKEHNLNYSKGMLIHSPKFLAPPLFLFAFLMGSLLNLGGGILFVLGCQRGRNVRKMKF